MSERTPLLLALVSLVVGLLMPPSTSWGADLVVHGPTAATAQRSRAALQRARLLAGSNAVEALHVSQVPAPFGTAVWIQGGVRSETCAASPRSVEEVEASLTQAIEALDALDDEAAERLFDDARAGFVCLEELVDTHTVWRYHFHRGVMAFNQSDSDAALRHFVHAVLADPDARWDTNYNPDGQQVFLSAREQVLMSGTSRLEIHDPNGAAVEIRLDGEVVTGGGVSVALTAGPHLIQYVTLGGDVVTAEVEVAEDAPAALLSRGGLDTAILAGPGAPGLAADGAAAALAALADSRGAQRVVVVPDGQPETVHTFEGGRFVEPPAPVGADRWRRRPGPRLGIAAGGGFLAQPSPERGSGDTFGALHIGVEIRLVRGLAVDLAGTIGLASFDPQAEALAGQTNVVPLLGFGLRYAFGYAVVRPYVGVRGLVRPNQALSANAGVAAAGGFVVLPHGPLRFQLEVHGGWSGFPHVAMVACVGVGF